MKIVLFVPSFNVGGVEKVMILLANQFVSNHYEVAIIAKNEGALCSLLDERVRVIDMGKRRIRNSFFFLKWVLEKEHFDCLISATEFCNFIAIFVCKFLAVRPHLIIMQHSYFNIETKGLGLHGKIVPLLIRLLYRDADFVVVVSDGVKRMLSSMRVPSTKIIRIYNPVDIKSVQLSSSECDKDSWMEGIKYLVYVGRLEKVKNVIFLLRAYSLFCKKSDYKLLIVGDGSEKKYLEKETERLKLSDKIYFIGDQTNPYPYIKHSSLLILPSLSESFGLVVVEALALGVTVISTPTAGVLEIDGDNGCIYFTKSFEDENELCSIMQYALEHPLAKTKLLDHALLFDHSVIMNEYVRLIQSF